MRALDDRLVGHGGDGRAQWDCGGWDESRGCTSQRGTLDEGGWRDVERPAAVGQRRVEREGDAPERRRLELDLMSSSQHRCLHRESRVVVAYDGRHSVVPVQNTVFAGGVRGGDACCGTAQYVRAFERRHGGRGALERAADLLWRRLGDHCPSIARAPCWEIAVHVSLVCCRLLGV